MHPEQRAFTPAYTEEIPQDVGDLYHYTDAGGFLGMIQYHKLWFTNIHYQNDSKEFYYAFSLLKKILAEEYDGLASEFIGEFKNRTSTVFTFSMSEKKDLLSQWRGYCPNGGFSISFNKNQINEVIKREGLLVGRCRYGRDEQRQFIIDQVIGFSPDRYREYKKNREDKDFPLDLQMHYFGKHLFRSISAIAPLLKHSKFSEEREWRLIKVVQTSTEAKSHSESVGSYVTDNLIKVRSRKNLIIPYIEIDLKDDKKNIVNIDKVVISPMPHKKLALESCRVALLAASKSINSNVKVKNSKIPYVNW